MIPNLSALKQPIAIRPELVVEENATFRVRQEGKAASSTKFKVFTTQSREKKTENGDRKGEESTIIPLMSVDGKYSSPEERRTFYDASGLPLFDLYHSPRGTTWQIEVPGGNSPSLAFLEPQGSTVKDDYKLQLGNAMDSRQDVVLHVQGQDIWKLRTNVFLGDQVIMTTKRLDKFSVYLPGTKVEWMVSVAEGMDVALASAIVVVMGTNMYTNGRSSGQIYIGKK